MAPPKFADLGKKVKDLFTDDYLAGENKLTLKSKASNGVEFKVEGKKTLSSVSGSLETKYSNKANGISLKEKWATDNVVTAELTVEGRPANSKHILETKFSPNSGYKGLLLKSEYAVDSFFADASFDEKTVTAAGVFQYNKYLFGAKADYSLAGGNVAATRFGAGYLDGNLSVNSLVTSQNNTTDIEGSVHLVHSPALETGVKFSWRKDSGDTGFEIGTKYSLDSSAWMKAKVDKSLNVGLSYGQTIRPGVSVIFSSKINGGNLNSDSHQLGFGITFDN